MLRSCSANNIVFACLQRGCCRRVHASQVPQSHSDAAPARHRAVAQRQRWLQAPTHLGHVQGGGCRARAVPNMPLSQHKTAVLREGWNVYAPGPEHKKKVQTPPLVHWQLAASIRILDRLSSFLHLASYMHRCWLSDGRLNASDLVSPFPPTHLSGMTAPGDVHAPLLAVRLTAEGVIISSCLSPCHVLLLGATAPGYVHAPLLAVGRSVEHIKP